MQEAGAPIQKGVSEGQQTCPSWHAQTQEEEGPEEVEGPAEVAACMCLSIFLSCFLQGTASTVLLCSIKMLVKQGAFVFMWIDLRPVHFNLYYS